MLTTYQFDPKYETDTDGFTFDLSAWIGDLDEIAATPTATVTPTGPTIVGVVQRGSQVSVWMTGGTGGQIYTIDIDVVTTGVAGSPGRNCHVRGSFAVVA